MLHAAFTDGPRVLCGELRAHVQYTKHVALWEGAARGGNACLACDRKHILRQVVPLIWPNAGKSEAR